MAAAAVLRFQITYYGFGIAIKVDNKLSIILFIRTKVMNLEKKSSDSSHSKFRDAGV